MKHKHAELIKAWADGAEIEWLNGLCDWVYTSYPDWHEHHIYRIKPEPKPDYVTYLIKLEKVNQWSEFIVEQPLIPYLDTLKLIRDGETGKIKSAEVIK